MSERWREGKTRMIRYWRVYCYLIDKNCVVGTISSIKNCMRYLWYMTICLQALSQLQEWQRNEDHAKTRHTNSLRDCSTQLQILRYTLLE